MRRLAEALDAARISRSRIGKEVALAAAFSAIAADDAAGDALATAARLAAGRTLPVGDGRTIGVGHALVMELAVEASGFPADIVRACARRAGDLGEALALLVARRGGPPREAASGASLVDVARSFDALARAGSRSAKRRILEELLAHATPLETKYLVRVMLDSLRVGAQAGVVEGAIARAFGRDLEEVRRALSRVTDPGVAAVLARDDRLGDARLEIGRPVAYMLATPLETIASAIDPRALVVEDKIDGIRAQVHKAGADVAIFARGLERVTSAFPEIVDAFQLVRGDVALDGELVALGEGGRPRPFQTLQARLNRQVPTAEMLASVPVTFIAYDLLADAEGAHLDAPWTDRRARLEAFDEERAPAQGFRMHPSAPLGCDAAALAATLDERFAEARARGHEGIVLKRVDAVYEAGRRGQSWIKVKRAFATLDVVVTAAEEGHGRRAGTLSDYTFAVWSGEELANVGKAYSGLTDAEIEAMSRTFEKATLERFGGVRLVKPEVVLEVAFDGIQRSRRHKSGFALRFPRIVRIRSDKRPDAADTLAAVEALYASQLESGHREDAPVAAPARAKAPKTARAPKRGSGARGAARATRDDAQLDLFGTPRRS